MRRAARQIGIALDQSVERAKAAVDALGLLRSSEAVEPMAELLSDADYDVRESVAVAFGRIGDRRAIVRRKRFRYQCRANVAPPILR